jgi:hypothetical protein
MIYFKNKRTLKVAGLLLCVFAWLANSSDPPNGRTAAPFDGHCNNCHNSNNTNNYSGDVTISGISSPIMPGQTYPITLTMSNTSPGAAPARGGFQLVVVGGDNNNAGDLISPAGSGTGTATSSGREYIEHRNPRNFSGPNSSISWTFDWTAPASASGNTIKMYFIGNFCDGGGTSGDYMLPVLETFTVEAPNPPSISITRTNVACFGGNTGSASADVTGGAPPYNYIWSNGQTTPNITNLTAGTYTVTVSGGGNTTATVVITQPTQLTATTSVSNIITCANTTANITANPSGGTGPYNISWPNGGSGSPYTVSQPGTYTATITDSNNCTRTASATVNSNTTAPNANATGNTITSCQPGATVMVSGQGSSTGANISYVWTASNGGTISGPNTGLNISASTAGTYTLLVTNNTNGCTNTAVATVASNVTPPAAVATGNTITCQTSGTVSVSGQGSAMGNNITYAWTASNGGAIIGSNTGINVAASTAGTYTLVVTNTTNNCTASASATVTSNLAPPNVSVNNATLTCATPVATLTANSTSVGTTYAWPNGSTTASIQVQQPGVYTVIATSPNGCTATSTATVGQDAVVPSLNVTGGNFTLTCATPTLTLTANASPAVTYAWSNGSTTAAIQVQQPNTYTVVVTSVSNGCTISTSASVAQDILPPALTTIGGIITCTTPTTQVSVSAMPNTATYLWQGPNILSGGSTAIATVGQVGTYTTTVTNAINGCSSTATAIVSQSPGLNSSLSVSGTIACFGATTGGLNSNFTGGTAPVTYLWSNGASTQNLSSLAAGTYTLTTTDAAGCTGTASATLSQPTLLSVNVSATNVTGSGLNNGTATVLASGGVAPYTYLWSNGQTSATLTGLAPGSYSVIVTDANQCTQSGSANVNNFNCTFAPSLTSTNVSCNGGTNGTLAIANGPSVMQPVSYQWSNSNTTQQVNNLLVGTYTATVTDATNCPVILTGVITQPTALSVSASSTSETAVGANNGTAQATVSGGTATYSYLWSTQATTAAISNLAPGVYTVTVTDANGCTRSTSTTVSPFGCTLLVSISGNTTACQGTLLTLTASPASGTPTYQYIWSTSATTASIQANSSGTYTVTITDNAGCTATATQAVTIYAPVTAVVDSIINVPCAGATSGAAIITVSGGGSPQYTYTYDQNGQGLAAGNYNVTVTNPNGCTTTVAISIGVVDNVPPVITCPPNYIVCDDGSPINHPLPQASDNCGGTPVLSLVSGLPNGSAFPIGSTTQTYAVADGSGNIATCSFAVVVNPLPDATVVTSTDDLNGTGVGTINLTPAGGLPPYTFQWTKDGQPFATTEDLSNLNQGLYILKITDANGCETTLAAILIDNVVGTSDWNANSAIQLMPNPTNYYVRLSLNNITPVYGDLFDQYGRLARILEQQAWDEQLDLSALPAGNYLLRLRDDNGRWYRARLVKL